MNYNFAFLYEVKNRELESIILLKCELERLGFSVYILETWERCIKPVRCIDADVVVTFALYNDETLKFVGSFFRKIGAIVNLQWEQIYTNGDANRECNSHDTSFGIRGTALSAFHVCWGKHNYHKLVGHYGVDEKKALLVGDITLDFLRREFDSLYLSKDELKLFYGIEKKNKIYLFISSFSYVNLPDSIINSPLYQKMGFNIQQFVDDSRKSQKIILDWFEKEAIKYPDITIIYRPHPAENDDPKLKKMEERLPNFRVIGEGTIKQWILRADKIYSWWSTSVAEIYASGKGCEILRPVNIEKEAELEILKESNYITSFKQFDRGFARTDVRFPVPEYIMEEYYLINDIPVYKRMIGALEIVHNNVGNDVFYQNADNFWLKRIKADIKKVIFDNTVITKILKIMVGNKKFIRDISFNDLYSEYQYAKRMARNNGIVPEEVKCLEDKIQKIILNYAE